MTTTKRQKQNNKSASRQEELVSKVYH